MVQSVSRCVLVVKTAIPFVPRWNEEAATLESFDQRVKLFVSSTKKEEILVWSSTSPRFDPEGDTFRYVRDYLTDVQLEAAHGSNALMTVKTVRLSVGPKSIQQSVRLLLDFFRLDSLRRKLRRNHETLGHVDSLCNTRKLAKH